MLSLLKYVVYLGLMLYILQIPQTFAFPSIIAFIFLSLFLFYQICLCVKEKKENRVHKDTILFTILLAICYIAATILRFIQ